MELLVVVGEECYTKVAVIQQLVNQKNMTVLEAGLHVPRSFVIQRSPLSEASIRTNLAIPGLKIHL